MLSSRCCTDLSAAHANSVLTQPDVKNLRLGLDVTSVDIFTYYNTAVVLLFVALSVVTYWSYEGSCSAMHVCGGGCASRGWTKIWSLWFVVCIILPSLNLRKTPTAYVASYPRRGQRCR